MLTFQLSTFLSDNFIDWLSSMAGGYMHSRSPPIKGYYFIAEPRNGVGPV